MAVAKLDPTYSDPGSDPALALELYPVSDAGEAIAVLRVELDTMQRELTRLDGDLRAAHGDLAARIEQKHTNQSEARLGLEKSVTKLQMQQVLAADKVTRHDAQLSKLWRWRDETNDKLWKLMLVISTSLGGGAAIGKYFL